MYVIGASEVAAHVVGQCCLGAIFDYCTSYDNTGKPLAIMSSLDDARRDPSSLLGLDSANLQQTVVHLLYQRVIGSQLHVDSENLADLLQRVH